MHIDPADRDVIRWAVDRGLGFAYQRGNGLSGTHLRVHIGHLTACFRRGKLIHLAAAADGRHLDQFMRDLCELFGLCTYAQGYLDQAAPTDRSGALAS